MMEINQKVRDIVNQWFKKQVKYNNYKGTMQGYIVTKSQAEKLKKELWRNIEFTKVKKSEEVKND